MNLVNQISQVGNSMKKLAEYSLIGLILVYMGFTVTELAKDLRVAGLSPVGQAIFAR